MLPIAAAFGKALDNRPLLGDARYRSRIKPASHRPSDLHGRKPVSGGSVAWVRLKQVYSGFEVMVWWVDGPAEGVTKLSSVRDLYLEQ